MESRWRDASFVFFFVESCFQRGNVNQTRVWLCVYVVISVHEQPTMLKSWHILSNVCKCIHVQDPSFVLKNVWFYICFQLWNINRLWQKDCVATCDNIYVSQKSKFVEIFCLYCDVKTNMSIHPFHVMLHYFDHVVVWHYFECTLLNMKAYKNN